MDPNLIDPSMGDPNKEKSAPTVTKKKFNLKKTADFVPTTGPVPQQQPRQEPMSMQQPVMGPPQTYNYGPTPGQAQPGEYPGLDQFGRFPASGVMMQPNPIAPGVVNYRPPPMPKPTKFTEGPMDGSEPDESYDKVVESIFNLRFPDKREEALMELGRKRESFKSLAPLMWYSFGTIAILLQELVHAYPFLSPPNLTAQMSSRVCSVLGLFQCLALHQDTRQYFLQAHLPLFLYPFLYTQSKQKPFENLRASSLGVIGALVKGDDQNVINFLLQTEIIPLCLRIMKKGQELSKTVATFIVQKILNDKQGLQYICMTVERLYAVSLVLKNMTEELFRSGKDEQKLLRHIIRCYLRLLEFQKADVFEHVAKEMPEVLKDPHHKLLQDESVSKLHLELLYRAGVLH